MNRIGVAVVGIGGFGASYLESVIRYEEAGLCSLEAVVVRSTRKHSRRVEELCARGVRIYRDLDSLLAGESGRVGLIAIPTGIDSHASYSIAALEAGYDVLCVKPVAGSVNEATRMRQARDRTARVLAIGFQDIFTPSVQRIKSISLTRKLGRLVFARAYLCWPRTQIYYGRNNWAGRLQVDGHPILDCPIQNAAAHYLNQMLYVAGDSSHSSLEPKRVYAENYRAKEIESADTQFVRVTGGADSAITLSLLASHAVGDFSGPVIRYQFEHGSVTWQREAEGVSGLTRVFRGSLWPPDPESKSDEFSNGDTTPRDAVFLDTLGALRDRRSPLCTIDNAMQHTKVVEAAFESGPIHPVGSEYVRDIATRSGPQDGEPGLPTVNRIIRGFDDAVPCLWNSGMSPAEAGLPWATRGVPVPSIP